jgi:leader peptidase (prepilin peptidase)/N-methyltransferase
MSMQGSLNGALLWVLSPWGLAILGLCVGSFLNVVIRRLPLMLERQWWGDVAAQLADEASWRRHFGAQADIPLLQQQTAEQLQTAMNQWPPLGLARPASHCVACGHTLRWHENFPVLGWLRLRGRCAACGAAFSVRYLGVELLTAMLFVTLGWRFDAQPITLMWCGVAAVALALALIDWDTTLLPDSLNAPLLWGGLIASALGWTIPLPDALWGAVAGYMSLWLVAEGFRVLTGQVGMGGGDLKLLAAIGAWLGWQLLLPVVLLASVVGALVGLLMKAMGGLREGRYVPFGPFLVGGATLVFALDKPALLRWLGWV